MLDDSFVNQHLISIDLNLVSAFSGSKWVSFFVGIGFERLYTCKASALSLEPHLQSIFVVVILEIGAGELFAHADL
jgi:hypothetical protein